MTISSKNKFHPPIKEKENKKERSCNNFCGQQRKVIVNQTFSDLPWWRYYVGSLRGGRD
jgi:hypothetical protein